MLVTNLMICLGLEGIGNSAMQSPSSMTHRSRMMNLISEPYDEARQSGRNFVFLMYDILLPLSIRRSSPRYDPPPEDYNPDEPKEDDSEARSVFVSQLAARLTARDLGYFFEDKLGEGTVMDARIVTDRISRRSKG